MYLAINCWWRCDRDSPLPYSVRYFIGTLTQQGQSCDKRECRHAVLNASKFNVYSCRACRGFTEVRGSVRATHVADSLTSMGGSPQSSLCTRSITWSTPSCCQMRWRVVNSSVRLSTKPSPNCRKATQAAANVHGSRRYTSRLITLQARTNITCCYHTWDLWLKGRLSAVWR